MAIVGAVAVPHPPVIVPAVGRGRESALGQPDGAYRQAARCVARWHPDTLVVISPHAPGRADGVQISPGEAARGDLAAFGAPEEGIEVCYDGALRACWLQLLRQAGLPAEVAGREDKRALDHGTLIPLLYLLQALFGLQGVIYGQSVTDFIAIGLSMGLWRGIFHKAFASRQEKL